MPKLPETFYVRYDDENLEKDDDDQFLHVGEIPNDVSIEDETIIVGVYELKKKVQLKNKTEVLDYQE